MKKLTTCLFATTFLTMSILVMAEPKAFAASPDEVFVTKNGKKYHKENCTFIKNKNAQKIAKKDGVQKGLQPCPRCFKEDLPNQVNQANPAKKIEKQSFLRPAFLRAAAV